MRRLYHILEGDCGKMGELVFVGLGLSGISDISLRGLEEIKTADYVFAEIYTNFMIGFSLNRFRKVASKKIAVVSRKNLEEENGELILSKAAKSRVVFLVPGDPLIATTHIDLRLKAKKRGIKTRIVHGASIISAVIGLSGLQNYKFGRSVTMPFPEQDLTYETPYNVVAENQARNLHTLCFLDVRGEEKRYMTIPIALELFLILEKKKRRGIITSDTLVIGIARAGSDDVVVKADKIEKIRDHDFRSPPHALVFPAGMLHFMEAEALIEFADAPAWIKGLIR